MSIPGALPQPKSPDYAVPKKPHLNDHELADDQHFPPADEQIQSLIDSAEAKTNVKSDNGLTSDEVNIDAVDDVLSTILNGVQLDQLDLPPLTWVVPGLIPEGCCLFIGAPKIGKSWTVLSLALAVASGGRFLGTVEVEQRDVLYLALEDGDRRLQDRSRKLMAGQPLPERLHRLLDVKPTLVPRVIRRWLANLGPERANRALVIVDTLQMARPASMPGVPQYEADSHYIATLKSISDDHPGLALVGVHHSRKARADDFLESASGTFGLTGVADTSILLTHERHTNEGLIQLTGREVAPGQFAIRRESTGGWVLDGGTLAAAATAAGTREATQNLGDTASDIIAFITDAGEVTPKQVSDALALDDALVRSKLRKLVDAGRIANPSRGKYTSPLTSGGTSGTTGTFPDPDATEVPLVPDVPPSVSGGTNSDSSLAGVPINQIGPCVKCGSSTQRYGEGGSPLCTNCQPTTTQKEQK